MLVFLIKVLITIGPVIQLTTLVFVFYCCLTWCLLHYFQGLEIFCGDTAPVSHLFIAFKTEEARNQLYENIMNSSGKIHSTSTIIFFIYIEPMLILCNSHIFSCLKTTQIVHTRLNTKHHNRGILIFLWDFCL